MQVNLVKKVFVCLGIFFLLSCDYSQLPLSEGELIIKDPAKDLLVQGDKLSSADMEGKIIFVNYWAEW